MLHHHNQHSVIPVTSNAMSSLSTNTNQRITATVEMNGSKQGGNSTSMSKSGNNTNRKNFKNMFYSPKNGGRDAITEPHSKMISQVQTKEHSPVQHHYEKTQNTIQGHHSKLRMSKVAVTTGGNGPSASSQIKSS